MRGGRRLDKRGGWEEVGERSRGRRVTRRGRGEGVRTPSAGSAIGLGDRTERGQARCLGQRGGPRPGVVGFEGWGRPESRQSAGFLWKDRGRAFDTSLSSVGICQNLLPRTPGTRRYLTKRSKSLCKPTDRKVCWTISVRSYDK